MSPQVSCSRFPARRVAGGNTWQKLWGWITSLPEASIPTLVVGIVALILVFGIAKFMPKSAWRIGRGCPWDWGDRSLWLRRHGRGIDRRSAARASQFHAA